MPTEFLYGSEMWPRFAFDLKVIQNTKGSDFGS